MTLAVRRINLSLFRNHAAARLDLDPAARLVVLTGENGAGKTNVLEAVSLLVPGKGLRGADLSEIRNKNAAGAESWAVAAEIAAPPDVQVRIGTGAPRDDENRRIVRIDGKQAPQSALAEVASAVWLTPQMDRLFIEGAAARRRFLDRLVYAYAPAHAARLGAYEKTLRERLKLLTLGRADPAWLSGLEARAAADGMEVLRAREALIAALSEHLDVTPPFPRARLTLTGESFAGEEALARALHASRGADAAAGRSLAGVHRADLAVFHAGKNMAAAQSSTGEQKALLVSLVLAHARLMRESKGFVPLLLLDEIAAHLDAARREQLFERLGALGGQVWLTGTDESDFAPLGAEAQRWRVAEGRVTRG